MSSPTETNGARLRSLTGAPAPPPVIQNKDGQRRVVQRKPEPPVIPAAKPYTVESFKGMKRAEEVLSSQPVIKPDQEVKSDEVIKK